MRVPLISSDAGSVPSYFSRDQARFVLAQDPKRFEV